MPDPQSPGTVGSVQPSRSDDLVPANAVRPLVDRWIAMFDSPEDAYQALGANGSLTPDAWRKRLTDRVYGNGTRGWWALDQISAVDVDELLSAMDATELWHVELAEWSGTRSLVCEDCEKSIAPGDYRPLDLMRPQPGAPAGVVWDSTKRRWAKRPNNARANGRRFRRYDLCRRCAAEVLRRRSAHKGTVTENGRRRALLTRERIAPKRGGRPRLLTDAQLRHLHGLYEREGLSTGDLADRLVAGGRVTGTRSGLYQAMLYGWRRLGLPLRSKGEAQALAHHRRGRVPAPKRRCPVTTAKGTPCRLGPRAGRTFCVSHQHLEERQAVAA